MVYFHYGKTEEMLKAIKHIKEMNMLGDKELLEEEAGRGNHGGQMA